MPNINQILPSSVPALPSTSMMLVNYRDGTALASDRSAQLKTEALAIAEQVQEVTNAEENQVAVQAQASLARVIRAWQNAEAEAKKPLNDLKSKIIALTKENIAELDAAGTRIGKLCADFQLIEMKRVGAARRLLDEQTQGLTRERDEKLSQAQSVAEVDAIEEEYRQQIADSAPAEPTPARAQGQVVKQEWVVTVQDVHMLYRVHPNCVKLTPLVSEIKALLDLGVDVKGVSAKKETKSTIRLAPEPKAIEV